MDGRELVTVLGGAVVLQDDMLSDNPAAYYLAGLHTESSRYMMTAKLNKVATMLGFADWQSTPWAQLTDGHVQALVSRLAEWHKPAYVNTILQALRGVCKAAYMHRQMSRDTYELIMSVKPVKGGTVPTGRYVTSGERNAILGECVNDETDAGRRDAAIFACEYPGGLRRSEIAALDFADVTDDGETLELKVHGKGRKERVVPIDNGGADAIRDWLKTRGNEPGPLFWPGNRGGHLERGKRISSQSVYEILKRRAQQAGVQDLGTHDLRRSVASDMLDIADAVTTADYLGHASTDTTRKYDRRGQRAKRKAAQGLHIAYSTVGPGSRC